MENHEQSVEIDDLRVFVEDIQYTEREKGLFQKIIKCIVNQKDFKKSNPIDIGLRCGYSETDIMVVIGACYQLQKKKREHIGKMLLFLTGDSRLSELGCIVSYNPYTEKMSLIKIIEGVNYKKNIVVSNGAQIACTYGEKQNTWYWRDEREGRETSYFNGFNVNNILLFEDSVIVGGRFPSSGKYKLMKYAVSGTAIAKDSENIDFLIKNKSYIYAANELKVWRLDKKLEYEKLIHLVSEGWRTVAMSVEGGEFYYYIAKGASCYKCSEFGEEEEISYFFQKQIGGNFYESNIAEIITTENYIMCYNKPYCKIYDKKNKNEVMNPGLLYQVKCIYEKDVFLGVNSQGELIKINMKDKVLLNLKSLEKQEKS